MPTITLNGIPISDEQCIGDSLEIINSAFQSISANSNLAAGDINRLYSATSVLSTTNVFVVATSACNLLPIHRNGIILLNNTTPTTITKTGSFEVGHRTVFIQVNTGKCMFQSSHFNGLDSNTAILGRYGVVTAVYTGSTFGWVIEGDLKSATDPIVLIGLVASAAPGTEDPINGISITGQIADTFYYYPDDTPGITPAEPMDIYVNGFYRSTVDFQLEKLGTTFGYKLAGHSGTEPQVTSKYKEGRIDLQIEGGNPVFRSLAATPTPGSEDIANAVSITGKDADVIYYYAMPSPTQMQTTMHIYVNGFFRTTVDFPKDRVGTQFGYKTSTWVGGAQVNGIFADDANVYLTIPGVSLPSVTEIVSTTSPGTENGELRVAITATTGSHLDTIAVFPWPGQSISPRVADIKVDGTVRTRIEFTADRIGTKFWYRLAGGTLGTYLAEYTFPNILEGDVGVIDLGPSGAILPTRTPLPTNVPSPTPKPTNTPTPTPPPTPAVTQTLFYLTATPAVNGGTDDDFNAINIRSVILTNAYNDTISYGTITLANSTPADPMDIFVNGVHRTTVDFPEGRTGTAFSYKLVGTNSIVSGVFTSGQVNLTITGGPTPTPYPTGTPWPTNTPFPTQTPGPTATPAPTPGVFYLTATPSIGGGTDDDINLMNFRSVVAGSQYNDTLSYNPIALPNQTAASPMDIYVDGVHHTTLDFPLARVGTSFGYRLVGQFNFITGTFAEGRVDLVTVGPTSTPFPTQTPYPSQTPAPTSPPLGTPTLAPQWNWAMVATTPVEDNFTGENTPEGIQFTAFYQNDVFYGQTGPGTNPTPAIMYVNINGILRGAVFYTKDRDGSPFGYKLSTRNSTTYQVSGIFADGTTASLNTL